MDDIENLLTRGVEEVIEKKHLEARLKAKEKLRIKLGIDPTSPNIHIGRAVQLWKLRGFQELGHQAVFIVGDFTAQVGDASDKDSERPMLTETQVKANMKDYFNQAYKILDKKNTEIHFNSEWLKKLGFMELAKLANLFGLHEFEAREVIAKRMKAGKRVSFHELLYPLMQGYDSVAIKADVEIGGTDQRFNLLTGRRIQPVYGQEPQDIMMTKILEGTDGRKMSSSWGNVINIVDEPGEMFGKAMSIKDELIKKYFVLATRLPLSEIDQVIGSHLNPRDQKLVLAAAITELYHGREKAEKARQAFTSQFSKGELPADIQIFVTEAVKVSEALVEVKLASSKSEARRLIKQGGIELDGQRLKEDVNLEITDEPKLLRRGRMFVRIKRRF